MGFRTYSQFVDTFKTGDIILFESPLWGSRLIEIGSDSPYSHVAMVVRLKGIDEPLLWESSLVDFLEDKLNNEKFKGVHLVSLKAVIDYCGVSHDYLFALRRSSATFSEEMYGKLEAFMKSVDGIAFPSIPNFVLQYANGRYFEDSGDKSKTYFCSELLTETLQTVGLMDKSILPNSISPGNYSTYKSKSEVKLLSGNHFSPEEFFIADDQVYVTHSLKVRFIQALARFWAKIKNLFS